MKRSFTTNKFFESKSFSRQNFEVKMLPTTKFDRTFASKLRQQLESEPLIQQLATTTLFQGVSPAELPLIMLEEIYAKADVMKLAKRATLKLAGHDFLYEILSGYVKIYDRPRLPAETMGKSLRNPPALLAWRIPGELLGDFKFSLPTENLTDHVVATDICYLLRLPSSLVRNLSESYPRIYYNIAANLASKAIKARIRAQILSLPNIESRVAKLFTELINERSFDKEITDSQVINGTFHLPDLAAFVGYKYKTTQQGVLALINSGFIDHYNNKKSGRFMIHDAEGLSQYIENNLPQMDDLK
jgi:CRP-like cAMP-binding protein